MKNCIGLTPATIYGAALASTSHVDTNGGRWSSGNRQPSKSRAFEKIPARPGRTPAAYRVMWIDSAPHSLAIVEGVKTMTGGEGRGSARTCNPPRPV
jgi:hypothetical protein